MCLQLTLGKVPICAQAPAPTSQRYYVVICPRCRDVRAGFSQSFRKVSNRAGSAAEWYCISSFRVCKLNLVRIVRTLRSCKGSPLAQDYDPASQNGRHRRRTSKLSDP